ICTPIWPAVYTPNASSPGARGNTSAPTSRMCCCRNRNATSPATCPSPMPSKIRSSMTVWSTRSSTRAFVPTLAVPTDHDKFFAAFGKFAAASGSHLVEMTIDQLKEYHSENVQYVEFMTSFECPDDRDKFIRAMAEQPDDAARLAALRANGLEQCVTAKRS